MFKKFSTKQLVFIALIAALGFVLNLTISSIAPGGTVAGFVTFMLSLILAGILIVLLIKTIPKFGTLMLFATIYAILEFPTPLGGAPGFWPKIVINLFSGFLGDVLFYSTKYKTWGIFVGSYIFGTINLLSFAFVWWFFKIPGLDQLWKILPIFIPLSWVAITVGLFLGLFMFKKLKHNRLLKQIQS